MYVGKSPSDDMKVPDQYHGVAVDGDGVVRGVGNDEELRRAEEMFRRGYVFESDADAGTDSEPEMKAEVDNAENTAGPEPRGSADAAYSDADAAHASPTSPASPAVSASAKPAQKKTGGLLSELFGRISSEDIILIGLIIILFGSGADDELLIMLAVLLIC